MIGQLLAKVIGTQNERELKRLQPRVAEISALEPQIKALSDEALRAKTVEFKQRVADGATVDDLLVEAFAVVREAGWRVLHWLPPCPRISMRSPAKASTSSP